MTRIRTPRPAMSARQVDRVEREVRGMLALIERTWELNPTKWPTICRLHARLTRLLASVRRSERR